MKHIPVAVYAAEADKMFAMLMGESPELRRKFIEENASLVTDLDI